LKRSVIAALVLATILVAGPARAAGSSMDPNGAPASAASTISFWDWLSGLFGIDAGGTMDPNG
jgi:hypothetical protein